MPYNGNSYMFCIIKHHNYTSMNIKFFYVFIYMELINMVLQKVCILFQKNSVQL